MSDYHRLIEPKKHVETLRDRKFCNERENLYALAKIYYDEEIQDNNIIRRRSTDAIEKEKIHKTNKILEDLSDNAQLQNYRYVELLTFSTPEEHKEIINDILDCLESIEEKLMELLDSKGKSLAKVNKERNKIGISLFAFTKTKREEMNQKKELLKRKLKYSNYTLEELKIRYKLLESISNSVLKSPSKTKKRSSPRTSASLSDVTISLGGDVAKPIKKVVCGKLRCIYKIHGSRKEHLKYKGRLITVSEYKKMMMKK